MSTSLRNLLRKADIESITSGAGPTVDWQRQENQSLTFYAGQGTACFCDGFGTLCWAEWCICDAMSSVTFELWGGGGGGAGSCNCAWGPPGGSGAYAKKSLDNSSNEFTGQYCFCVGTATCCSPDATCGWQGCHTWVVGSGLENFCAEGGLPGCSLCNFFGCFPTSGCGILLHPEDGNCACYYGADSGVGGKFGFLQSDCESPGNFCYYKVGFPVPAGIGTEDVTYKVTRAWCNINAYADDCRVAGWTNDSTVGGGTDIAGFARAMGKGGNTARVCAGGCCCGSPGGPGMIKISWI